MPKVDRKFIAGVARSLSETYEQGETPYSWAERQDLSFGELVKAVEADLNRAIAEDTGPTTFACLMFQLGYEVRRAQEKAGSDANERQKQEAREVLGGPLEIDEKP